MLLDFLERKPSAATKKIPIAINCSVEAIRLCASDNRLELLSPSVYRLPWARFGFDMLMIVFLCGLKTEQISVTFC